MILLVWNELASNLDDFFLASYWFSRLGRNLRSLCTAKGRDLWKFTTEVRLGCELRSFKAVIGSNDYLFCFFLLSLVSFKALSRVIRVIILSISLILLSVYCFKIILELDHKILLWIKPSFCLPSRNRPFRHARIYTQWSVWSVLNVDMWANYLHIVKVKLFNWQNLSVIGVSDSCHFISHRSISTTFSSTFVVRIKAAMINFSTRSKLGILSRQLLWLVLKQ